MIFNLKEGMIDEVIYDNLNGKIQGESTQQVQQFFFPRQLNNKDLPKPLHVVTKSNDEFAVIKKNSSFVSAQQYYLSGINDEGTYFVHELPSYENIDQMTLDQILKDVNLKEYEFERIQGDLLVKFFSFDTIINQERDYKIDRRKFYEPKQKLIDIYPWVFNPNLDTHLQYGISGGFTQFFETYKKKLKIFNNHVLSVKNGRIYEQAHHGQFAIMGESFTLKHNQHQMKLVQIPRRHYAVITTQKSQPKNRGID